jgi:hypothetical protein
MQQLALEQQQHTNEQMYYYQQQQGRIAHEELRLLKKEEGPKGFLGALNSILGVAQKGVETYSMYSKLPGVPLPSGQFTPSSKPSSGPVPYYGAPYAPSFTPTITPISGPVPYYGAPYAPSFTPGMAVT